MSAEGPRTASSPKSTPAARSSASKPRPTGPSSPRHARPRDWEEAIKSGSAPVVAANVSAASPQRASSGYRAAPPTTRTCRTPSAWFPVEGCGRRASRAAVDAGYVPSDLQVCQTGKIIASEPDVAIAFFGVIQHLTNIKDVGASVAINKDGDAPIFEAARIDLVDDLLTILPRLENAMQNSKYQPIFF